MVLKLSIHILEFTFEKNYICLKDNILSAMKKYQQDDDFTSDITSFLDNEIKNCFLKNSNIDDDSLKDSTFKPKDASRSLSKYLSKSYKRYKHNSLEEPDPRITAMLGSTERYLFNAGHESSLICNTLGYNIDMISWTRITPNTPRVDKSYIFVGLERFINDDRFSILMDQIEDKMHLKIKNTQLSDEGTYECIFSGDISKIHVLNKMRLTVKAIQISGQNQIKIYGNIKLKCNATSKSHETPINSLKWMRGGQNLIEKRVNEIKTISIYQKIIRDTVTSLLIIKNVSLKDSGIYKCIVNDASYEEFNVTVANVKYGINVNIVNHTDSQQSRSCVPKITTVIEKIRNLFLFPINEKINKTLYAIMTIVVFIFIKL
ncbi:hypothetical protein A3Q56_06567 [Intoshia linei]|uniref:Ig-like domain-containing protein n=1 Tax=Intoshia linei TaxID=1819745 RepID=A0A177AUQ9_9BILA|nr:hypothetical protein A3Q56_06567 [Intoshia linei]